MLCQQATDRRAEGIIILFFKRGLLTLGRGRFLRFCFRAAFFTCAVTFAQALPRHRVFYARWRQLHRQRIQAGQGQEYLRYSLFIL